MSFTKSLCCASSTLALLAGGVAHAQTAAEPAANEIVVTGTSIRGVAPVGAPVMKMSQEEIKDTGLTNSVELLRKIPQVVNIGADEARVNSGANTATANTFRASGINIRGLGTQATLTLVDGQRPAPAGLQVSFFDPATIPTIALSGMELVTDGASAIYGADAIAGVANFILRKNFDGFEVRANYTTGNGYEAQQYSGIAGKTWTGGSAMLAADYTWRPAFAASERPDLFIGAGTGATTVAATATIPQYQTTNSFPTTLTAGGVTYAVTAGGVTPITTANVLPGANQRNVLNIWDGVNVVGLQERTTLIGNFQQELGDRLTIYGQGFGSRRTFDEFTSAAATANLTIRNTNPYGAFLTSLPGAPTQGTVAYSFIDSIGPGNFRGYEDQAQAVLGARVKLWGDFQADVSAAQNYSHNDRLIDAINNCALTGTASNVSGPCTLTGGAIGQTSLTTAFNPFGVNSQAVLDSIRAWTIQRFQVQLREIKAKVDGTLMTLPGGDVKIAVGADYIHQKNWFNNYTTSTTANNSIRRQTSGNTKMQDITAAFVEVVVPVIGPENQTAWAKSLQLSAAGRVDWYSIYDDPTKNPKLGITYAPTDDLTLRTSYSTSFRSGLKDIDPNNAPNVTSRNNYFDYSCNCQVWSLNRQGGNPLVRPETSRTFTAGGNYKPSFLPGLDLDLTFFKIAYNNIIDMPGNTVNTGITSAAQEALYGAYLTRRPAASDVAGTAAFNALATSLLNSPYYTSSTSPTLAQVTVITSGQSWNSGSLRTKGFDISAFFDKSTEIGDFTVGAVGTYYLSFDRSLTPTEVLSDKLNTIDNPTTYRIRGQLGWKRGGLSANAFVSYTPSYDNTGVTPIAEVDSYTVVDANVAYELESPNMILNGLRLGVSAQNLFDTDPPFARVAGVQNYDSQVASPYGRLVSINLSKRF